MNYTLATNSFFEKRRFIFLTSIGILLLFLSISLSTIFYIKNIRKKYDTLTKQSVENINIHFASYINNFFNYHYKVLEVSANTITKFLHTSDNNISELLNTVAEQNNFSGIMLVSSNNSTLYSKNFDKSINDIENLKKSLLGNIDNLEKFLYVPSLKDYLLFSVPIKTSNNTNYGILTGFIKIDVIQNALHPFNDFNEHSVFNFDYSYIFDTSNSSTIVKPLALNSIIEINNYNTQISSQLAKIAQNDNANHGLNYENFNYHGQLIDIISSYTRLTYNNLYLITFLPVVKTEQRTKMLSETLNFIFGFLGLVLLFFLSYGAYLQLTTARRLKNFTLEDPITQGGNGTWFNIEAEKIIQKIQNDPWAIIILNIDKFKVINDKFGREAGDKTLHYIYKCICKILTPGEIVSRINNDNFCILIKNHSTKITKQRIELLSIDINSFNKHIQKKFIIYISCGVCQINDTSTPINSIQEKAMFALYSCKNSHSGSAKVAFYNENEHKQLLQEKEFENRMENALEQKQFVVYLQPKYNLEQNEITGAEALTRWLDPDGNIIMPNDFIPIFERNGFILQLDLCIFEQVCSMLQRWIKAGITPIIISVNLSRAYINDYDFLSSFDNIRRRYDIPAKFIELEITESVALDNMNWLIEIINKIHEKGFSCSLDDFGSGYSSLNVLKNIPIDVLKLDRKFFTENEKNYGRGNTVIESVIELARKLNIKTVSEGVEDAAQIEFLRKTKCDMVQSFYYSKPITMSDFEKLLFQKTID